MRSFNDQMIDLYVLTDTEAASMVALTDRLLAEARAANCLQRLLDMEAHVSAVLDDQDRRLDTLDEHMTGIGHRLSAMDRRISRISDISRTIIKKGTKRWTRP